MKKIIALALVLILLIGCLPAHADVDTSKFIGAWGKAYSTDAGGAVLEIFFITENKKVFYLYETFSATAEQTKTAYVGLWYPSSAGIHIVYGKNQEANITLLNDYYIGMKMGTMEYSYGKLPDAYSIATADIPEVAWNPYVPSGNLDSGAVIYPGEYVAGYNFPSGTFLVQASKKAEVEISVYHESVFTPNIYRIGGGYPSQVLVVTLDKNCLFSVSGSNVTISRFDGYGF